MPYNIVDNTASFLLAIIPTALLIYCMLVSPEARRAVARLPRTLFDLFFTFPTRPTTTASVSSNPTGPTRLNYYSTRHSRDTMLKREVDKFRANATKKSLSQSLFPSSSPPVANGAPTRPLLPGSANIERRAPGHGIKRAASGLAKALPVDDGFEEPQQSTINSQRNPIMIDSSSHKNNTAAYGVYFDENDFDSDIDLDVEDPATKGQIKYPELPTTTASRSNISPTLPRKSAHVVSPRDSGYERELLQSCHTPSTHHIRSTPNEELLPWSSSPLDHFKTSEPTKTLIWNQYSYAGKNLKTAGGGIEVQTSRQAKAAHRSDGQYKPSSIIASIDEEITLEDKPRPSKRRTLPWLQQQAEEMATPKPSVANTSRKLKSSSFTPQTKKADLPWNTTASAIKEQQKQLRQANKKLVKTNEATEADKSAAVAARKATQLHSVFLSEEQQHVLNLVVEHKKSVFFTGSAGTGKSVLLREIITALRKRYLKEPDRIAVTASTGLAACNVGGVTLHSFAGIGLGKEDVQTLVKKIRRNPKAKQRWMRTKVLIVDEVSMVDGELFDKLEEIARTLRNNGRPFGGIQLIITGDFFQLPPVPDHKDRSARFAFEAATWTTSIEHTIGLHHVFRQKDPEFATMLNEMREGRLSSNSIARFRTLNRPLRFEDALEATELFPTRYEVDNANTTRMRSLQGELRAYEARDSGTIVEKPLRDKLLQNCMAPETIHLKKGAQVMLIKNIDETLVNGSLGKVIGFMSEQMFDNYQANEEEYYATQGAGDGCEEEGGVPDLSERKMKLKELAAANTQVYPVVRFVIADGSTRDLLCQRETWKVELPNGEVQASRAQIPLILAWALSIHKAQGQTLPRVKVDLGRVFEKGQAYVALSRATSMKGLQVLNFNANKVMAHEKVRTFYAALSRVELNRGEGKADMAVKKGSVLNAKGYEKAFVEGDRYLDDDHEWEV